MEAVTPLPPIAARYLVLLGASHKTVIDPSAGVVVFWHEMVLSLETTGVSFCHPSAWGLCAVGNEVTFRECECVVVV